MTFTYDELRLFALYRSDRDMGVVGRRGFFSYIYDVLHPQGGDIQFWLPSNDFQARIYDGS